MESLKNSGGGEAYCGKFLTRISAEEMYFALYPFQVRNFRIRCATNLPITKIHQIVRFATSAQSNHTYQEFRSKPCPTITVHFSYIIIHVTARERNGWGILT